MNRIVFLLVASMMSLSTLVAKAQIPDLEFPPNPKTRHEFICQKKVGLLNRQLELYEAESKDVAATRELALPFLRASIERFAGVPKHAASFADQWDELESIGRKLIEAECSDPIVLLHYADALLKNYNYGEARKMAERALKGIAQSDYPEGLAFLAHYRIYQAYELGPWPGDGRLKSTLSRLFETSPSWFDYADEFPDGAQVAWDIYLDAILLNSRRNYVQDPAKSAIEVYSEAEAADPWIVSMLKARYYRGFAWKARGGGFSGEVQRDDWTIFKENLQLAAIHARNAYEVAPDRPDAPAFLIQLAMAGGDEATVFEWFEKAIQAEIDYPLAYWNLLTALLPRWGGSHEAMLEFGKQCAMTKRYESDVPRYLSESMYKIIKDNGSVTWSDLLADDDLYGLVEETINSLVEHPIRKVANSDGQQLSAAQVSLLSQLLGMSENSNRFEKSIALWNRLGDDVSDYWCQSFSLNRGYHPKRAQAAFELGAVMQDEVLPVLNELGQNLQTAQSGKEKINQWLTQVESEAAKGYFRFWDKLAQQSIRFHEGEWVNIEFEPGLPAWFLRFGDWQFESPESVLADNRAVVGSGLQKMFYRLRFPGNKEIEFTMAKGKIGQTALGGVAVGDYAYRSSGRLFFNDLRRKRIGVNVAGKDPNSTKAKALSPTLVRTWSDGKYEVLGDGQPVVKLKQDSGFRDNGLIGLSTAHRVNVAGQLRFQNVRLRKLIVLPKPKYGEYEKLVEYFSRKIKDFPKDMNHYAQRGINLHRLGRYREAIDDLERCNQGVGSFRTNAYLGHALCRTGDFDKGIELLAKNVNEIRFRLEDRHGIYQRFEHIALLALSEALLSQEIAMKSSRQLGFVEMGRQLAEDARKHHKRLEFYGDNESEEENAIRKVTQEVIAFESTAAMAVSLGIAGEQAASKKLFMQIDTSKLSSNQTRRLDDFRKSIQKNNEKLND